ncbi:MAG: ABC transporter ATP-binding protein [Oscillospiraceae bacterium]
MIEVKNLTKRFDRFTALNGLTMTVPTGSVYGLVGPNGAGKSTIIRHITGVYRPDSGEVLVGGEPVFENPPVKARIACIPDDLSCHAGASIRELKSFFKGLYPAFSAERFTALADIFKLDQRQPLRRFSKGMQKQAAFWLAICTQPDYLVLDEPVDGLDPVMRKQVWSVILEDVATRGTTVLVSSHNLRELEDVCDHVGVLHEGKMLLERSLSDLQENIVKVQIVTDRPIPPELNVLHKSMTGRIQTLIVRGDRREIAGLLQQCNPLLCDLLPLSLEEIFIYELGGVNYDVKNLVL